MKKLLTLLLATSLVFASCAPKAEQNASQNATTETATTEQASSEASEQPAEKALVVAQIADAVSLDPHKANDSASATPMKQIYNTLVTLDENMKIAPSLAEEWKNIDELTWEFKLRKGVKFHNGEELKASDVVFTFNRFLNPETATVAGFMLSSVEGATAIDDYTVQIKTKQPFAPLPYNLTHFATSILNEKAVTEAGENYAKNPVGTGAYKFVEWKPNQYIKFAKNEEYFEGTPGLDSLTFRIIPESATSFSELKTGGVDMVLDVQPQLKGQFESDANLSLLDFPTFTTKYLGFDERQKPFNDPKVRLAINYATNKEAIIKVAFDNNAEVLAQPLTTGINGYNANIKPYEYDIEKAKTLLTEAGYPDGFSSTLYISDKEEDSKIGTILQSQLAQVGIKVELQIVQWGKYLEDTANGVPMFILGWTNVTADADNGLYSNFHSENWGKQGNRNFYKNEKVDELLTKGRTEFNSDERTKLYEEASQIAHDDAAWDFLLAKKYLVGINKRVKNYQLPPTTISNFYSVTVE